MNNYAYARGIVCSGDDYICLVGTDDADNIWKSFVIMKLNKYGVVLQQKLYTQQGHNYYAGSVGGTLKESNDGNYIYAYHANGNGVSYSSLVKFNNELDTLWKRNYTTELDYTNILNCSLTSDNGYILCGRIKPESSDYMDFLLLKTDSLGNEEWLKMYGTTWSEHGQNVIQTPDGGYLIGGYFWKPGVDHSLDAMVVKTDSLGNEEWTKYYGNPDVDDDMAFVALADDGNYLVATVYGEYIVTSEARAGKLAIYKVDQNGNTISMEKHHPLRRMMFIKNFKKIDNSYLATGWSDVDTISLFNSGGWLYKFDNNLDSIWRREYQYFDDYVDVNYLYDFAQSPDNGYVAIGQANEAFTQSNMWVIKLDSMGCDTPGCINTVIDEGLIVNGVERLRVWPNPAGERFQVSGFKFQVGGTKVLRFYNSQGVKVEEVEVPEGAESVEVDVSGYGKGLYFLQYVHSGEVLGAVKVVVR